MTKKIIFFIIVCTAIFLRFYKLGEVPVSPDWDEAALGYNAYSILTTGKDEYGTRLPMSLRSFDDYKPPLYAYLTVPSVALFGLDTWSTRLPSAVMGVLAVIGTYFFVKELLGKYANLSAFLLAISPWHLQFSRIAFEANTGVTLNIWAMYALLRARSNGYWMILSAFLSGLALYAYHSERIFVPLLIFSAVCMWRKELFIQKKWIFISIIVGFVTILPLIPVVLDKTSLTRLQGTSALADKTGLLMGSVGKLEDHITSGNSIGAIFDNRRIVYGKKLAEGYLSHFSLKWLFLTGDNDRHHAPDFGLLYLWELPFVLWGMLYLWKKGGVEASMLFIWFFLAPLAASPTSETPHAIRTLVFLPIYQIFTAIGLVQMWMVLRNRILWIVFLFCVGLNIAYYFHLYYAHMNHEYSRFWQYGYKQAVEYAEANKYRYKKIVVSTDLEQPHMFFLFYTKYDPERYLREGGTASGGFAEVRNRFDIYEFRKISDWDTELHDGSVLYIGTPKQMPEGVLLSISYVNGEEAMRISE